MALTQLNIHHFRNLSSVSFSPNLNINIIQGPNGSGKTSLLEAIYFLSLGKSFRSHLIPRIVQHDADQFSLFGKILTDEKQETQIGIEKCLSGKRKIRIAGEDIHSVGELAKLLPLQLIDPHAFQLVEGGPARRRQLIDWGVFHVEHQFLHAWRSYSRALKQRNLALKSMQSQQVIESWDVELVKHALQIDCYRKEYLQNFIPLFEALLKGVLSVAGLSLTYYSGWKKDACYGQILSDCLQRDRMLKYTQFGPHHADLVIRVNNIPAKDMLSRGQQKLFVSTMKVAQGCLYQRDGRQKCIYLLDDLMSELDEKNQDKIMSLLMEQNSQLFVTCAEANALKTIVKDVSAEMFHVEQLVSGS